MPGAVYVAGGFVTPFIGRRHPDFVTKPTPGGPRNPSLEEHLAAAVRGCLAQCGAGDGSCVDRAWVGNGFGELFSNQGHLGAAVGAAAPGLLNKPSCRLEGACASGGLAFEAAVLSVRAGCDVVLAAGAEVQTTATPRVGGDYLARASHYAKQRGIDDFTFPALFARRIKAYRERYGVEESALDLVALKAYANAARNPLAHMRSASLSAAQAQKSPRFLKNAELAPWLKSSDCSQVSDGAAAAIVASEQGLRKLGLSPSECVEVAAVEQATGDLFTDGDLTRLVTVGAAAQRAYAAAGLQPRDVGIAEVHDCFTVAELMMCEALGLAPPGGAPALVRSGATAITGRIPVNTGGGLLAFGHPVGATGIKQVVELWKQMQGKAGSYQVAGRPAVGIAANMGGDDKTAVVTLLRRTGAAKL
eukprot:TRINITY_DN20180_c0_g1_i1.p1 TRINITY_DN20180_c0_g1~~TRINITY_DN20180_c0_g1_i1.p1  ORF type:complete len:440 (+),score=149.45 TRINITY_DN20180_c0_g1_i1:69-1322(+)